MKAKPWMKVAGCSALVLPSCVRVEPIEVKPIHIVMDVNIRIDRELDEFFAFEKQALATPASAPMTQPTGTQ